MDVSASEYEQMALLRGASKASATFALALTNSNEDKALDMLDALMDMKEYLGAIGIVRPPDDRLLRYIARPKTSASDAASGGLLEGVPHDIKLRLNLLQNEAPICEKVRLIAELCRSAPSEHVCYENALGLPEYNGYSHVVLSKRLLRFLCGYIYDQMRMMQRNTFQIFDKHVNMPGFRDRVRRNTMRSVTFFISLVVNATPIADLRVEYDEFMRDEAPTMSGAKRADLFGAYVKRRVRRELLYRQTGTIQNHFIRNQEVQLTFAIDPHVS